MVNFLRLSAMGAVAAMAVSLCSCGDDPAPEAQEEGKFGETDEISTLTVQQQKQRLESVALEALNYFRPEEHREAIELANYFTDAYGDLEIPSFWESIGERRSPAAVLLNTANALRSGDIATLAYGTSIYYYDFPSLAGVYEPGSYEWKKVSNSNDIVFRFYNASHQLVVLTVSAEGSNNEFTVDPDRYTEVTVVAPRKITTTLTNNGNRLLYAVMNVNIDEAGHAASYDIVADVVNIHAEAAVNATDALVTGDSYVTINGVRLASASAKVNGAGMATRSKIEELIDYGEDYMYTQMFHNAVVAADVLGKVQARAHMEDLQSVFDVKDMKFMSYHYSDKESARRDCENACIRLNNSIKSRLYFDGSNTMEAEVLFSPVLDEWDEFYGYGEHRRCWEWKKEPLVKFADGSTYSFEGYFDANRFMSAESSWNRLWDSYSNLWR